MATGTGYDLSGSRSGGIPYVPYFYGSTYTYTKCLKESPQAQGHF